MNFVACHGRYDYFPDRCGDCPRYMDDCDGAGPFDDKEAPDPATRPAATLLHWKGEVDFDPVTGVIQGTRPLPNGQLALARILRVDVEEWKQTYPDEPLTGKHDGLDFGFWYREHDGTQYSPPWRDWRKRHHPPASQTRDAARPESKPKRQRRITRKEAHQLEPGTLLCAKLTNPAGGGSRWSVEQRRWIDRPLPAGEVVRLERVMPKVRVITGEPWQDGLDELFVCTRYDGTKAWLHIGNARRVEPEEVCTRTTQWLGKVETIQVAGHSYAWSGQIPCTGVRRCIYCGAYAPEGGKPA